MQQTVHHNYIERLAFSEVGFSIGQNPFNFGTRKLSLPVRESQCGTVHGNNGRARTRKCKRIFSFASPEVENSKTFREGMV
jgi:hypothetical protein